MSNIRNFWNQFEEIPRSTGDYHEFPENRRAYEKCVEGNFVYESDIAKSVEDMLGDRKLEEASTTHRVEETNNSTKKSGQGKTPKETSC